MKAVDFHKPFPKEKWSSGNWKSTRSFRRREQLLPKCQYVNQGCIWMNLLISAPRLIIFCRSLCLSVCHGQTSNWFFFFVSRWNQGIFWLSVLHVALYKTFSSIFDLGPIPKFTPQNSHLHKIAYKSACMADRPDMFGPTRGFSGMADSMEPCKMLWSDPCCHGNDIWARCGDLVAYQLV